jgi:hypothetical protein
MSIKVGLHMPASVAVSIAHRKTLRQVQFDSPKDLLVYLQMHPELANEIENNEYQWTIEEPKG